MNVKTYNMLSISDISRATFSTRQKIFEKIPLPVIVFSVNNYITHTYMYRFDIQAIADVWSRSVERLKILKVGGK